MGGLQKPNGDPENLLDLFDDEVLDLPSGTGAVIGPTGAAVALVVPVEPKRSSFDAFQVQDASDGEVQQGKQIYDHLSSGELRTDLSNLLADSLQGKEIQNLRLLGVVFHTFFVRWQECNNEFDEVSDEIESLAAEVETKRKTIADEIRIKREAIDRINEVLETTGRLRWLQRLTLNRQRMQFKQDIEKILDDHGAKLKQTAKGPVVIFVRGGFFDKEHMLFLKKERHKALERIKKELDTKLDIFHEFFYALEANGVDVHDKLKQQKAS